MRQKNAQVAEKVAKVAPIILKVIQLFAFS